MPTGFTVFPAIDLLGGRCVRLLRGDYDAATEYERDPIAQAKRFVDAGASWIHVVDLDAARTGERSNADVIAALCGAVDVPVQVGGGVRSADAARSLSDAGVERVVIGTAAVERPELVSEVAGSQRVAVGLDGRRGRLATHGWTETTDVTVVEAARRFADAGADAFIVTDIDRDGTLEGPDESGLMELMRSTDVDLIASGGVGSLDDLVRLAGLRSPNGATLQGAIVGKALYEEKLDLAEALMVVAGIGGRR